MIYLFLADGFEETEAIVPLDILKRVEVGVTTVGIGGRTIIGAHGVPVGADFADSEMPIPDDIDGVILPGGMPGTLNLEKSEFVRACVEKAAKNGKLIAAICAAPSILGRMGLLCGKKATCFDGFEGFLGGAEFVDDLCVVDGNVITARGAGAALEFGFAIAEYFVGKGEAELTRKAMKCRK